MRLRISVDGDAFPQKLLLVLRYPSLIVYDCCGREVEPISPKIQIKMWLHFRRRSPKPR